MPDEKIDYASLPMLLEGRTKQLDIELEEKSREIERKLEPNPLSIDDLEHLTDVGNANRLAIRFGKNIRYCHPMKSWFIWDGTRWKKDEEDKITEYAVQTVAWIYSESAHIEDKKKRKRVAEHAMASESVHRIRAMITLAKAVPGIPILPSHLDSDPWLFNCTNGTVNLKTGELIPHNREHMISKISPVDYQPNAESPLFQTLLEMSTGGNQELIQFIQRAAGYSLCGSNKEECLFFVYGPTASGKSTFTEAYKATMGDYALTADFSTFLKRRPSSSPRTDIARLSGSRMVVSLEVDEGSKLAEGLIKAYTGGDTLTARHIYQKEFEFVRRGVLWLVANNTPLANSEDDAIWRRIHVIPFSFTIPKDQRIPEFKAQLCDPTLHGSAILAWAVKGCLLWQNNGLSIPPIVSESTSVYRSEVDPIQNFISDYCSIDINNPEFITPSSEVWNIYQHWATENGIRFPLTRQKLAKRLKSKGIEIGRMTINGKTTRIYIGILIENDSS